MRNVSFCRNPILFPSLANLDFCAPQVYIHSCNHYEYWGLCNTRWKWKYIRAVSMHVIFSGMLKMMCWQYRKIYTKRRGWNGTHFCCLHHILIIISMYKELFYSCHMNFVHTRFFVVLCNVCKSLWTFHTPCVWIDANI